VDIYFRRILNNKMLNWLYFKCKEALIDGYNVMELIAEAHINDHLNLMEIEFILQLQKRVVIL
jgi:hypothetical protein